MPRRRPRLLPNGHLAVIWQRRHAYAATRSASIWWKARSTTVDRSSCSRPSNSTNVSSFVSVASARAHSSALPPVHSLRDGVAPEPAGRGHLAYHGELFVGKMHGREIAKAERVEADA